VKLKDTANHVIDTLQQHPILKGMIPSGAVGSLTFVEELEIGLRIAGLIAGLIVAGLTGYAQWLKIRNLK
jgi:hypothetical protein